MSEQQAAAPATPAPAAAAPATPPAAAKPPEKPGAPPAEQKPAEPRADAWAKLSAAEKKVASEREEIKKGREELEKMRGEVLAEASKHKGYRERLAKGEIDEVMAEFGVSYSDWTKRRLAALGKGGQQQAQPPRDVEKLVSERVEAALKAEREAAKKAEEEASTKRWAESWGIIGGQLKAGVEGLELVCDEYAADPTAVERYFKNAAEKFPAATPQQIADSYEAWLLDKEKRRAQIGKVKALYAPPPAEAAKQTDANSPRAGTGQKANEDGPRTLTNALAAESTASVDAPSSTKSRTAQIRAEREAEKRQMGRAIGRLNQG